MAPTTINTKSASSSSQAPVAETKKSSTTKTTKSASSSFQAQAAEINQTNQNSGRKTRSITAKANQAASTNNNQVASTQQDATTDTVNKKSKPATKATKQTDKVTNPESMEALAPTNAPKTKKAASESGIAANSAKAKDKAPAAFTGFFPSNIRDNGIKYKPKKPSSTIQQPSAVATGKSGLQPGTTVTYRTEDEQSILVTSDGQGQSNQQKTIDQDTTKYINAEARKPKKWGTQVEAASSKDSQSDFESMGFGSEKVEEMMTKPESLKVDGYTQRWVDKQNGSHVAGTDTLPEKKKASPRGKAKYKDLVVFEGEGQCTSSFSHPSTLTNIDADWVLFDVLKPYPVQHGTPPPAITKWATYQKGNARILVMNPKSQSIRSQSTPEHLRDVDVEYTESGPKIKDWMPVANPKRRVKPVEPVEPKSKTKPATRPTAQPAESQEAPLLGRGARRNARRDLPTSSNTIPAGEPKVAAPKATKRKADLISSDDNEPTSPASKDAAAPDAAPKKLKTEPISSAPPPASSPPPMAAAQSVPKGKKRKSDEISDSAPPVPSPAPSASPPAGPPATKQRQPCPLPPPKTLPPRALKGKRKIDEVEAGESAAPAPKKRRSPSPQPDEAASVGSGGNGEPVASESLAGEGKQKRKRRAGRSKKTPAIVENSSSENE